MECKGVFKGEVKPSNTDFYLVLTTTSEGKPCVAAVYEDGSFVPNGRLFVFFDDHVINVSHVNPELGFRTDSTGGIAVF